MKKMKSIIIVCTILFLALSVSGLSAAEEAGKININTASADQLAQLEHIGAQKADKIIEHREQAPFKTIEEITLVKGIGQKTFEKIKGSITVGDALEKN